MNRDDRVFYRDRKKIYNVIDRGEGIYLYDREGKKYIDGVGGTLVVSIGHGVPEVVDAMLEQAKKVSFLYGGQFVSEPQIELAKKVIDFAPAGMCRVYFVSGGSEATEVALKLVRQYYLERDEPSRVKVVGRWQSYHGATVGALSLSGHTFWRKDYLPYMLDFPHVQAPYCYRCRFEKEYPSCGIVCAYDLERTVKQEGKESIAAFISEPVSGSPLGAMVPPPEYFPIVREICDRYGILLVVDEVITGFGRTGKNFAVDHWNVVPDLIIAGKGISSGYTPLGAVIVHEKVFDLFAQSKRSTFFTGYSYSGNPLSCAVGLKVLEYVEKHDLIARVARMEKYLFEKFSNLNELPIVGDVRGKGLLLGIEFVADKGKKTIFERSQRVAENIAKKAVDKGLVLLTGRGLEDAGVVGDILVIGPPFIIKKEEIDMIFNILWESISEVSEEQRRK